MGKIDRLAQALQHMDPEVRWVAILDLERMGGAGVVDLLALALRDNDNLSVRWRAAYALGNTGSSRAVEPLIGALSDESQHVRSQAAASLGRLADPRAAEPLILRLLDPDPAVRITAFRSLVEIGAPARQALKKASGKGDEGLQKTLKEILHEIDERERRRVGEMP
ncbi:MAG: HEAT repeat domain-containing protein [Methanomicrobiaceae archaeon]|uniref:HEAT repeat domain-containing protein n=1 Tax=hydrocarbon metagenome TaxID=938273 RepID=A0A0W8FK60_9ZZZZ|nr:HEAT repeat domain-containing protein [Methanomicrobiaceae archaeon]MDD5419931.1 HEAT repeat domain-containing protein [Methanomicrobiaceae archaeon]